jgi:cell division protein FtsB
LWILRWLIEPICSEGFSIPFEGIFLIKILYSPFKVAILSFTFVFLHLILGEGVFRLAKLQSDEKTLKTQIEEIQNQNKSLDMQVKMAQDPVFIERQAVELYGLAQEHDLVFVFNQ